MIDSFSDQFVSQSIDLTSKMNPKLKQLFKLQFFFIWTNNIFQFLLLIIYCYFVCSLNLAQKLTRTPPTLGGGGPCLEAHLEEYALTFDCHTLITNWTSMYRLFSDTKFRYLFCCVVIIHSILSEVRNTKASRPRKQNELVMHLLGHSLYPFFATALATDVPCIIRLWFLGSSLFISHYPSFQHLFL